MSQDEIVERITAELAYHVGEWRDNGADCHCMCGYRPKMYGEFHGRHVAVAVAEAVNGQVADV